MVVRSLAAFLSVQVPSETELRLQPSTDLQLSAKAQQVCAKTAHTVFSFSSLQLSPKNNLCFSLFFPVDADVGDVGGHAQQ